MIAGILKELLLAPLDMWVRDEAARDGAKAAVYGVMAGFAAVTGDFASKSQMVASLTKRYGTQVAQHSVRGLGKAAGADALEVDLVTGFATQGLCKGLEEGLQAALVEQGATLGVGLGLGGAAHAVSEGEISPWEGVQTAGGLTSGWATAGTAKKLRLNPEALGRTGLKVSAGAAGAAAAATVARGPEERAAAMRTGFSWGSDFGAGVVKVHRASVLDAAAKKANGGPSKASNTEAGQASSYSTVSSPPADRTVPPIEQQATMASRERDRHLARMGLGVLTAGAWSLAEPEEPFEAWSQGAAWSRRADDLGQAAASVVADPRFSNLAHLASGIAGVGLAVETVVERRSRVRRNQESLRRLEAAGLRLTGLSRSTSNTLPTQGTKVSGRDTEGKGRR